MNLKELFEMQKKLDEHIIKEKGLERQELLPQKILALQVELGELANEWRGFKFWSEDQEPRTSKKIVCDFCQGTGDENIDNIMESAENSRRKHEYIKCLECNETGIVVYSNPLLEEYVDCLHFILSIGLETFNDDIKHYYNIDTRLKTKGILQQFQLVFSMAQGMYGDDFYRELLQSFLGLGEMLGFTEKEIVVAYKMKNATNHERQQNGY